MGNQGPVSPVYPGIPAAGGGAANLRTSPVDHSTSSPRVHLPIFEESDSIKGDTLQMVMERIWQKHRGRSLEFSVPGLDDHGDALLYAALLSLNQGVPEANVRDLVTRAVERAPEDELARWFLTYLDWPKTSQYSASNLRDFLRCGGIREVFFPIVRALQASLPTTKAVTVLALGPGAGTCLLSVLPPKTESCDVVERSHISLDIALKELVRKGVSADGHAFHVSEIPDRMIGQWTASLAVLRMEEMSPLRAERLLVWLSKSVQRALFVEFDVPSVPEVRSPDHADVLFRRFRGALAAHRGLRQRTAALEFLMPILLSEFNGPASESGSLSILERVDQCERCGFRSVVSRKLVDHWWAPIHLVVADRSQSSSASFVAPDDRDG